ncbi:hypothetical protein P5G50_02505 [Leifsonia sp. F6_8S_P_1B]|uniref:DUF4064 domain-containing protein n=1 Tax=Leifsonia williamsii TaxID=3035919 RepID=A0ABT8K781_9MICO|nr:hypothetical protein [Leifsonia williamsii]MDN4613313.1 hypothetical protein [Leifsonia williamsii]
MSTPDENTPQQPAAGNTPGSVPPVPPAAPVPPAEPAPSAASYNPPPAPPAPGAYPASSATGAPVAAPTAPPTPVNVAFWLFIASALLSVIGGIITLATIGGTRDSLLQSLQTQGSVDASQAQQVVDAAIGLGITWAIVTLIFWAVVFVVFAFFMRRGANWARIVLTVLTALSLLNIIAGFGLGALQVVASIVAVVLMWLRPSTEYFNAVKASKAPRA